jgi:hypothetical protein
MGLTSADGACDLLSPRPHDRGSETIVRKTDGDQSGSMMREWEPYIRLSICMSRSQTSSRVGLPR